MNVKVVTFCFKLDKSLSRTFLIHAITLFVLKARMAQGFLVEFQRDVSLMAG
jgi:hypothetical protein